MRRVSSIVLGFALVALPGVRPCVAADAATAAGAQDPFFGEALFNAYQGHWFEALQRLDSELAQHYRVDEQALDSLYPLIGHAEFSVGDFELNYRMHHRAGRAIKAVLEADVPDLVRNEAAFRLARIHFQKGQPQDAMHALERIRGDVPEEIRDEIEFLRANAYLAMGQPAEAAAVLKKLLGAEGLQGFAGYNYGIALLQDGKTAEGQQQLAKAGEPARSDSTPVIGIRDKTNMVLGRLMLEANDYGDAQRYFDRVSLDGPYSNQALLSAGWADAMAGNYERALVPWNMLAARDSTDSAVQEAKLALPHAYGKLNLHGRAAVLYDDALNSFGTELARLDASTRSVRDGHFLKALVREEIHQDQLWVVKLRELPDAPETFYLTKLMASHDFQTALQNYLDLEDLRRKMESWQAGFDAYDDLIGKRKSYYEPLLPGIDSKFRELDAQYKLRREQRNLLARRLNDQLTAPRPELLATSDERMLLDRINATAAAVARLPQATAGEHAERIARLRGVIDWDLRTEYADRLTVAHEHLEELDAELVTLHGRYQAFVRARQASVHSYTGYDDGIRDLRNRVRDALERVGQLQKQQGSLIEEVAIAELTTRSERLKAYQTQARYAVADSYDRASQAQGAAVPAEAPAGEGK
ncbi:tetratricopeptide repeat protein [Lysobacter niastensis]|uniref:Tetratricopeptide repeat protein n=1 Tax=Lysobacter niastensis TaxID=380629 RepID=A0ABS0B8M2_9GAMM|nr:tetratricopeptide repeat protein [Lysobacter niastensis]MBF6023991.1 tetratricopeptide repeat protein [Lysobacter niastensis]